MKHGRVAEFSEFSRPRQFSCPLGAPRDATFFQPPPPPPPFAPRIPNLFSSFWTEPGTRRQWDIREASRHSLLHIYTTSPLLTRLAATAHSTLATNSTPQLTIVGAIGRGFFLSSSATKALDRCVTGSAPKQNTKIPSEMWLRPARRFVRLSMQSGLFAQAQCRWQPFVCDKGERKHRNALWRCVCGRTAVNERFMAVIRASYHGVD